MKVKFNGKNYEFRKCDTKGITQEELQKMTETDGKMQYEPRNAWLVIKGVGYGWETNEAD